MKKFLLMIATIIFITSCSTSVEEEFVVSDYEIDSQIPEPNYPNKAIFEKLRKEPFEFVFDTSQDMQLPEMPNGCEAVALTTLLRLNAINVTKFEVADTMPKGDDFVNQYWGDPYSITGWACMAPCSTATANMFVTEAVDMTGTPLLDLPLPATIWVTIDMAEPVFSGYESQGYRLMNNPHCITITTIGVTAKAIDPLKGWVELDIDQLNDIYQKMGSQAIVIKETNNGK